MRTAFSLVVFVFLFGCSKKSIEPSPAQLLLNGDMEAGTSWPDQWFIATPASIPTTDFSTSWSTDQFSSPGHSLSIARTVTPNSTDFYSLGQTVIVDESGKTLTFSVKIKGVNLAGDGVSIAIRTDTSTTQDLQFSTTQGQTSITGTFDWKTFSVKLTGVQSSVEYIDVYLVFLPNTTGTVYFDDAELVAQ
jgi:hypothetical protein